MQVYDYVDANVPVLGRMYGRRLRGYKTMGYAVTDDTDAAGSTDALLERLPISENAGKL